MIQFFRRVFFFFCSFVIIEIVLFFFFDTVVNNKSHKNSVFIWGDSQVYQGIDLNILRQQTGKKVYTAAKHGAGVYDFLVFAESIPNNSFVIVAISDAVQLRFKDWDRNTSGLSISALNELRKNNYTKEEIIAIINRNRLPSLLYYKDTKMYTSSDSIVYRMPVSVIEDRYAAVPSYLQDKQNLYLHGVDKLIKKKCEIIFIKYPYHEILHGIEKESIVKEHTERLTSSILGRFENANTDTLRIDGENQIMDDLTHFNELGAQMVSKYLAAYINKRKGMLKEPAEIHKSTSLIVIKN